MTEISPAIAARTALTEDLLAMAYQVEEQLVTSVTALKDRNPALARLVLDREKEINSFENRI